MRKEYELTADNRIAISILPELADIKSPPPEVLSLKELNLQKITLENQLASLRARFSIIEENMENQISERQKDITEALGLGLKDE